MNNVNMAGMNAMGGPVGGTMPMNGAPGVRPQMRVNDNLQRSQLNTYIYEYFIRNGMYDCARTLLNSDQPIKVIKDSPGRRRDDNGNGGDDGGDGDSKDDLDSKRPDDLPAPDVPRECPESCFLYEWWCLFWEMFNAQRGKGDGHNVMQYVAHTQQQSRLRQEAQQNMLRGIRAGDMMPQQYQQMMMRNQANPNGMTNELRQKAIQNNRNATPQQLQMMQQKQQQMQRDPSSGDNQQRAGSPGSAENAPSPSKRPRLDGGAPFNPQQQMPNGRGQSQGMPQQVGESGPSNAIQAAHMQLTNGIEPNNLTAQQFPNMPGGANAQQTGLAGYQAGLANQQRAQMPGQMAGKMPNAGPQSQGSPMMAQGQGSDAIAGYYNAGEMGPNGGMRGGQPGAQPGGGNHALQDYQMQLMLLEQQNKKRLMMARQEQDSMTIPGREGQVPGAMGPNGQPFQQGASPQGARSVNSPNPSEQMKRGTPHMNPAGMPSPLPEGQSRGSPGGMNFNIPGGQMDPNMARQNFMMGNGMDPNVVGAMPNGMRPPSSHPAGAFVNGNMTPQQQMAMAQQRQAAANANWQGGPNGQMIPGPNQGGPPQPMGQGTPQQRAMPPPAAVPVATNGRTPSSPQQGAAPPTPQQGNKAAPSKKKGGNDAKETKAAKRAATKKGSAANLNSGATPSAEASQEPATPTPATPITPVHPKSFQTNGAVQPVANGQTAAPANVTAAPPQADPLGGGFPMDNTPFDYSMEFANPNNNMDVLQDFDFDSFLHQDGDAGDNFNFDAFGGLDGNEIGAE